MNGTVNAAIIGTELGFHDGFGSIPNLWIRLEYDGSGQGFGGWKLGGAFTHYFIYGVLMALEVESWEKLKGKPCRVILADGKAVAIGHFLKEQWCRPGDFDAGQ